MYVEQRLTICEACCRVLALQYHWAALRVPSSRERIFQRAFACPACGHFNSFFTLMYAHGFVLKAVPGPDPEARLHQSSVRRVYAETGGGRTKDGIRAEPSIDLPRGLVRQLEQLWFFVLWQLTRLFG